MNFDVQRRHLVEHELRPLGVRDTAVLAAMCTVPREAFIAEEMREFSYRNAPLPIGSGGRRFAHDDLLRCPNPHMRNRAIPQRSPWERCIGTACRPRPAGVSRRVRQRSFANVVKPSRTSIRGRHEPQQPRRCQTGSIGPRVACENFAFPSPIQSLAP